MKLTGRQRAFLGKFLDLYREIDGPLHYTTVAERLGVGKVTAYDMLRLLEEKGLVSSEYTLPVNRSAGRSSIVFHPTPKADEVITQLAGKGWEQAEWQEVKEQILQALRAGRGSDYHELLNDIFLRINEQSSPLLAAAEMVTAVILSLNQLKARTTMVGLSKHLQNLGFPGEMGLNALAGLTVGLAFAERANRHLASRLTSHVQRFQDNLSRLSAENKQHLSDFAQEVWKIVGV